MLVGHQRNLRVPLEELRALLLWACFYEHFVARRSADAYYKGCHFQASGALTPNYHDTMCLSSRAGNKISCINFPVFNGPIRSL
jgi:hypothetical protein